MFENEIQFISDFSHNKLKKFGSFVTYEKLAATDLHPAILSYISAELDYMIFKDRKKLLDDSIFDYSGREISDHFNVIALEIKRNKKIAIGDVRKLIVQAVSFNVNYVVRPKWSATKLIYNDQNFVPVDELERMLNYLYYYDYIKNVLSAYISRRKVIQLTITEFDLILNKIDRELFKSDSEELINNALHSIADFFNIGGIDKNRISLTSVEIFLKDKNLMDYLLKLRKAVPNGSRKKYGIDDIKKVLYATIPLKPESITGYEISEDKKEDEIAVITDTEDAEPQFEEIDKSSDIEDRDSDETEIVTEEKIKNHDNSDTVQKDEDKSPEEAHSEDELLPIEAELQQELISSSSKDNEIEFEEEIIIENSGDDQEVKSELADSIDEENNLSDGLDNGNDSREFEEITISDDEGETEEVENSEPDELLSFYEQELESLDDDLSEFIGLENENQNSPDKTGDELTMDQEHPGLEIIEIEDQDQDTDTQAEKIESENFKTDDFDLSIFEDTEDNEVLDEIIENLNGDSEKDSSVREEEPGLSQEEFEKKSDEKKIIDEMLEDYFGSDEIEDEADLIRNGMDEDVAMVGQDTNGNLEIEDKLYDTEESSSIIEDSSLDDDISKMLDEIDDILEKNTADAKELEKDDITPVSQEIKKPEVKEKKSFDEKILSNDSAPESFTLGKKLEDPVPKIQIPLKQKELLSYLNRKEIKKIVSNVFSGDEEDFVNTVEKISEINTYKEATEILKGVFFTYRVSPYSKDAVILTNAVSHFFRQV